MTVCFKYAKYGAAAGGTGTGVNAFGLTDSVVRFESGGSAAISNKEKGGNSKL